MKLFVLLVIPLGALLLYAHAHAAEPASEAQNYLNLGCRDEGRFGDLNCKEQQQMFVGEYQLAFWGEYQGQRNVAYCLAKGCADALFKNPVQGCAWRLVIAGMGHAEYDSSDAFNLRNDCEYLSEADAAAAKVRSIRILGQIDEQPSAKLEQFRTKLTNDVLGR